MTDMFAEFEALLEAEGLGVIDPRRNWDNASKDIKHIKGKHKRLDALVNEPAESGRMTNSPVTARAVDTRFISAADIDVDADFDDGTFDIDEDADNAWDLMTMSFIATPKEAELADRKRAACFGLDDFGRPRSGKVYRKKGETDEQYRERVADRLGIATDEMGPLYTPWRPAVQFASADAGGGPLAVPTRPKPDRGSPRRDEELRPSPVVDTLGYASGRSPFQLSLAQRGRRNSDITSG